VPDDLVIFTYGNGVPMACARRAIEQQLGWKVRVVDLRWLVPLDAGFIAAQAASAAGAGAGRRPPQRRVGEGVVTALVEAGFGHLPLRRVCGADTYTLAGQQCSGFQATMR
jgi:2-oxoisovalerate dehydrogenase E1 component